jgi:hypothetical protein
MTEVTVTSGYPVIESMGSRTLYIWKSTDVDDAETVTTNLGTRIIAHWVEWTGNPGTQASAGGHSTEASGLSTLYPSSDDLGATIFVLV